MIKDSGFQDTFFWFGLWQGVIICVFAFAAFAAHGRSAGGRSASVIQSRRQYAPSEIIGPTSYWVVGALIALAGGLAMWAAASSTFRWRWRA